MAEKVSQKTEITYPLLSTDTIYIIRGGNSFKGNLGGLFRGVLKFVAGYDGYQIIPGQGNVNDAIVQAGDILKGSGAYFDGDNVELKALGDNPSEDADFEVIYREEAD